MTATDVGLLLWAVLLPFAVLAPAAMTGVGSRRRGSRWAVVALSAVLFPITWVVWYLRDRRTADEQRA